MTAQKASHGKFGVALVIVDVQNDFLEGGALAVQDANQVLDPISKLIKQSSHWDCIVATQDFHPPRHISFASSHEGSEPLQDNDVPHPLLADETIKQRLWPDHCIQGTKGVALQPQLLDRLKELRLDRPGDVAIIRKGNDLSVDGYSGLSDNAYSRFTPMVRYLSSRELPIDVAVVVGLATDFCVFATAMDLLKFNYRVVIPRDSTRGVDAGGSTSALDKLRQAGAVIVDSAEEAMQVSGQAHGESLQGRTFLQQFQEDQNEVWRGL